MSTATIEDIKEEKEMEWGHDYDEELWKWVTTQQLQLSFNWTRIFQDFFLEYSKTFARSKKAHFDSLPAEWTSEEKVVDGARSKWCNLLIMDALIYFLQHKQFDLSYRRTFNQQKVLSDCIMKELQRLHPNAFTFIVRRKTSMVRECSSDSQSNAKNSLISSVFDSYITIQDIFHPWEDLHVLKENMLREPTSKSKRKFQMIIDSLCSHQVFEFYNKEISSVLSAAIFKAVFVFPLVPGGYCFSFNSSLRFTRNVHDGVSSLRPPRPRVGKADYENTLDIAFQSSMKLSVAKIHRRDQDSPTGVDVDLEASQKESASKIKPLNNLSLTSKSSPSKFANFIRSSKTCRLPTTLVTAARKRTKIAASEKRQENPIKRLKANTDTTLEFEPLFSMLDDSLDDGLVFEEGLHGNVIVRHINPNESGLESHVTKIKENTLDFNGICFDWMAESSNSSETEEIRDIENPEGLSSFSVWNNPRPSALWSPQYSAAASRFVMMKKRLPEYYERNMTDVLSTSKIFYDHLCPAINSNACTNNVSPSPSSSSSLSPVHEATKAVEDNCCAELVFSSKS